ncbi:amino acid adenylation domain-containing protein [Streptomyces cuspidosporus]|uniref:AMP-dependent synthetase/ligase domain-containing protein n=1 Tax=Streptomyces cuspidosporus TaxID=66882 RepID=A0ABP5U132_9ACTN
MSRLERMVSSQAAETPGSVAVVSADERLTYLELEERSNRLAQALRAHGFRPGERVALLSPKSARTITYVLGVLKAGGVCVPMDTASPVERLLMIVRRIGPCWLLADDVGTDLLPGLLDKVASEVVTGLCLPGGESAGPAHRPVVDAAAVASASPAPLDPGADDSALAYILFTSGSSGEPKGVSLTHRSIAHFVRWANGHFGMSSDDRVACHLQLHFDFTLWDVYGALSCGAGLHLVPPAAGLLPSTLADFLRDSRITHWNTVPSVLSAMARYDVLAARPLPDLRRVVWGGEVFPPHDALHWRRRLPQVRLTGVYGTTETAIASTYHTLDAAPSEDEPLPIGVVIPGESVTIVDKDLTPLPQGAVGEIVIGGAGVGPGYWNDPERTASAFVEFPPGSGHRAYRTGDLGSQDEHGVFHFHGRADRQVKVNGYRIELDEIMTALNALPGVAAGVTVAVPDETGRPRICAAYSLTPGTVLTPVELQEALSRALPSYMLPAAWAEVDPMPVSPNGKIDIRALQGRFAAREGAVSHDG